MPSFTGLTRHDQSEPLFLNDWNLGHNAANKHAVDVQVRSGDYFVTLATVLDELATSSESYAVRSKLEDIVSDLIYLQDTYAITKNNVNVEANRNINQ
jgi:hypothetical protein